MTMLPVESFTSIALAIWSNDLRAHQVMKHCSMKQPQWSSLSAPREPEAGGRRKQIYASEAGASGLGATLVNTQARRGGHTGTPRDKSRLVDRDVPNLIALSTCNFLKRCTKLLQWPSAADLRSRLRQPRRQSFSSSQSLVYSQLLTMCLVKTMRPLALPTYLITVE